MKTKVINISFPEEFLEMLSIFKRLYKQYVKKNMTYVIVSLILMLITGLITAGIAYIIGPVINKVFIEKQKSSLVLTCIILVTLYVVKTTCSYIQNICLRVFCEKTIIDMRINFFEKIIKLPMKDFDLIRNGKITSVFLNDINGIKENLEGLFVISIRDFLTVIFLTFVVFYNNFVLTVISLCIYPIVFVPFKKITKSIGKIFETERYYLEILTSKLTEIINGIKTIKTSNTEQYENHKMKRLLINLTRTCMNVAKKQAVVSPLMELICGLSLSFVIFIGGWQIINGYSDVGSFFSFFTALIMVHRPARSLSGVNIKITSCFVLLKRVFFIMDNLDIEDFKSGSFIDLTNPTIKFKHVNFDYAIKNRIKNENDFFSILCDVNLEIKPRQKIAIVGSSGSGKSTIVSLITRLYSCESGEITINEKNINEINLSYLRKNIAYVGQDNFLFNDTIKNNILYGSKKDKISEKDINDTINKAQIDFLKELVKGINENVGDGGSRFSLGQKQRIAIARAIIKDAPIMIFDEASSALDVETERKIHDVIFNKMKDKTIIIIAHRLSTVVDCDNIYVMKDGKIIEQGTHSQLLNDSTKTTYYKRLWQNLNHDNIK